MSILSIITLIMMGVELLYGSIPLSIKNVWDALLGHVEPDSPSWVIVNKIRLPRAITAASCGMALSISGLLLQTLFRNPLAGPSVLGISSGATLGVSLWMLTGALGMVSVVFSALAGSWLVLAVLLWVAGKLRDNTALLIFGIMLSFLVGALVNVLEFRSTDAALRSFVMWGMGSFSGARLEEGFILGGIAVLGSLTAFFMSNPLNALLLGEDTASSMGISVSRTRFLLILVTGVLVGFATAFCGPVAFIGLAVPHLSRMITGESDHRILIPFVALMGASIALLCDLVSQLGVEGGLPINTVTSFIGAPVVIYLILSKRRKWS
jgi:iron complex transport system permease protein